MLFPLNPKTLRWFGIQGIAAGLIVVSLATGCGPRDSAADDAESPDLSPDVQSTLAELTHELRRTMMHERLSGSFDEFAAANPELQIPPSPEGKKYAISKQWKVVLVDQKATGRP